MRWIASLAALGLLMTLFHRFTAAGPLAARATLALGFLLLAATVGGELAHRYRLSRIPGFLIVGFATGPAWLGLVRADEIAALAIASQAGIAVLAFAAGNAVAPAWLRADRPAITRVLLGAAAVPFAVTSFVVLTIGPWFPLTVHQPAGDVVATALVLGGFAAVSSSAVAVALRADFASRGAVTRTILGVASLQDLLAPLLLLVVIAVGAFVASPGAVDAGVARVLAGRFLLAVLGGALCGIALARSGRWIEPRPAVAAVVSAVVAVWLARWLQVEFVVVALVAGFAFRIGAPAASERFKEALPVLVLPVAAGTFALAGAVIDRGVLEAVWPWVLLLVGLRATGLWLGMRWASRHAGVAAGMARSGWLGFLSQGGLVLGLAGMARRAFPEWGVSLEALLLAMIGVYEITGPLCFGIGLRLAGEVPEETHGAEHPGSLRSVGHSRYSSL